MAEVVYIDIGGPPEDPLPEVRHVPAGSMVIVGGDAPAWRYGMMLTRLHGSAAGAICVHDPARGAVVVLSRHHRWREGQVVEYEPPTDDEGDGTD